ncbi:MAG: hypothetical protein KAS72_12140 [Phycisphaerales bacterium]|nr:hypothetical protein [Phycisphaerales bacterium]
MYWNRADAQYYHHWESPPQLQTARHSHRMIAAGSSLYVIGGVGDSGLLDLVERYDLTDPNPTWVTVASLQTARHSAAATVDGFGRIWVLGGLDDAANALATTEIYDPRDDTWVAGPLLGVARSHLGAVTDDSGYIWAIGGCAFPVHTNVIERIQTLDPDATWMDAGTLPGPVSQTDISTVGANNGIYIVGGWLPGYSDRFIAYYSGASTWRDGMPLPEPRNNMGVVAGNDGFIYVVGGDGPCASVYRYDTKCDADINEDGTVDQSDLGTLLSLYGETLP